mmetsp:Transcript_36455/g.108338  ORF Transcript_36455/g.108338 Transcript_36455/m.108338 type:complete len:237 (-) Transcript_36455:431-1141(-)
METLERGEERLQAALGDEGGPVAVVALHHGIDVEGGLGLQAAALGVAPHRREDQRDAAAAGHAELPLGARARDDAQGLAAALLHARVVREQLHGLHHLLGAVSLQEHEGVVTAVAGQQGRHLEAAGLHRHIHLVRVHGRRDDSDAAHGYEPGTRLDVVGEVMQGRAATALHIRILQVVLQRLQHELDALVGRLGARGRRDSVVAEVAQGRAAARLHLRQFRVGPHGTEHGLEGAAG